MVQQGDARPDRRRRRLQQHPGQLNPGCLRIAGGDEVVADRCWALGATALGELPGALEVGFATVDDAAAAAEALRSWRPGLAVEEVDAADALDAALEAWKPHARPVRVGRLVVRPSWLAPVALAAGEREVVVDPTRAFGFDHPTTRACLAAVDEQVGEGTSVLDVGCGSGVLALAAAALGAGPVVAVDTDPVAVAATARAAAAAGFAVDARTGGAAAVDGTFDLVVANIGAATLVALVDQLAARVAPGGWLVLSGLLVAQAPAVVEAYRAAGLEAVAIGEVEGWATPVFVGKSTFSGAG